MSFDWQSVTFFTKTNFQGDSTKITSPNGTCTDFVPPFDRHVESVVVENVGCVLWM